MAKGNPEWSGRSQKSLTDLAKKRRRLVVVFHRGGSKAKKAARELKKLGIRAWAASEIEDPPFTAIVGGFEGRVYPFVKKSGHRQMPARARFTNRNYERVKAWMAA